jgi:hypothetical protein
MSDNSGAESSNPSASAEISASEVDSGEESSEEGEQSQPTAAEIKKIKKLKLKFNGKEIEEDLPFEIEEAHADWLVKQRQKAMLADHKANEYSNLERQIGAFLNELKANPKKVLRDPNINADLKALAAEILEEEIVRSQKTPEELRAEEAEAKLQELMSEREKEKQEAEAREFERLMEREYERYDTLMSSAIESSDLPQSPYVVKKMTEMMMLAVENNIDIDPKDIIPLIRDEIHADIQQMFGKMPAELIEQIIGKETLGKLKNHRKSSVKPPVPVKAAVKDVAQSKEEKKESKEQQTIRGFFGI